MENMRIEELENSLNTTDWIITRIHEAQLLGEDITPLMEKYRGVITQRQLWREELDRLKKELEV